MACSGDAVSPAAVCCDACFRPSTEPCVTGSSCYQADVTSYVFLVCRSGTFKSLQLLQLHGGRIWAACKKQQHVGTSEEALLGSCQQLDLQHSQHKQLQTGTKRYASQQTASQQQPSSTPDPAAPPSKKPARPWQCDNSISGGSKPWMMRIAAPGQQQSAQEHTNQEHTIMPRTGASSVHAAAAAMWSVHMLWGSLLAAASRAPACCWSYRS
jgi:hypothetical protein